MRTATTTAAFLLLALSVSPSAGPLHAQLKQYIRTTTDDLRSRVVERQGSDAYQWALLISTHEQRHILQIREIKSHQRFPH